LFGEKGSRLAAESHTAAIDRTHPLPQVSWVVAAEQLQSRIHGRQNRRLRISRFVFNGSRGSMSAAKKGKAN